MLKSLQNNTHVNHLSPDLVNPFGLITKRCNNKSQIWSIKVKNTIVTFYWIAQFLEKPMIMQKFHTAIKTARVIKSANSLFYLESKILSFFFDKLEIVESREVIQLGKWNN